ncbi:MAG: hypothetical protein RH982_07105 [Parvibaculum sp.]
MLSRLRPGRRMWLAVPILAAGAAVAFVATNGDLPERFAALRAPAAGSQTGGGGASVQAVVAPGLDTVLADFRSARQASLVALRGYLLTNGEGFRTEWLDATVRLQSAANAIERQSTTWTDGRRLVQFVEMQRVVGSLLTEQRAVASIIGTENRYPGLQLFNEDVVPALDEAQALCAEVLSAMLADSSPEDAAVIDPVARLRGDLDALRSGLATYVAGGSDAQPPAAAGRPQFSAMLKTLRNVRGSVPAALRPKIDRLTVLIGAAEEKLQRVFALRASQRWDYAGYAFQTRIMPLSAKLESIETGWEMAGE